MIKRLTIAERQTAMLLSVLIALAGFAMAVIGRGDPMGVHGWIVLILAGALFFALASALYEPEPTEDRAVSYYDDPTKVGILLTLVWAVAGMGMGVWVAAQLAWPDLRFDAAWSSFGRIRPVHTSGVIFGFGGNALIATSFHIMQRTSRARMAGHISPWFVLLGFNLFCIIA
ncbi:cbb3-type cytochrome c oxidase subunit I, partial [Paracoccus sp. (in: a-proteobacteria)]